MKTGPVALTFVLTGGSEATWDNLGHSNTIQKFHFTLEGLYYDPLLIMPFEI